MIRKSLNIALGASLLAAGCFIPQSATASYSTFGYVVRHVLYENENEQLLVNKEGENFELAKKIHDEMVKQVGYTQQIRSSLGDERVMYEKDRMIATLEDYDNIMRSLLFFQTRDKNLLSETKNQNFKVIRELASSAKGMKSDKVLFNVGKVMDKLLGGVNPSMILRKPADKTSLLEPEQAATAGDVIGGKFFIHAYTQKAQKKVPSEMHNLVSSYRTSFANDVAKRNYILSMYARAYLAERSNGNGIGRHLYGSEELIDKDANPWSKKLNIIAGVRKITDSKFVSALKTKTYTPARQPKAEASESGGGGGGGLFGGIVSFFQGIADAITGGGGGDSSVTNIVDACKNSKDMTALKLCIWEAFSGTGDVGKKLKDTDALNKAFSFAKEEMDDNRIPITSIRQQISLNTIMWLRATLEVSSLMILTSAHLEQEAAQALSSLQDKEYWINPTDQMIWGETICDVPEELDYGLEEDDGTRWKQDCLSEQERLWLTPSFDWENHKYKYPEYIITGDYPDEDDGDGSGGSGSSSSGGSGSSSSGGSGSTGSKPCQEHPVTGLCMEDSSVWGH